LCFKILKNFA